MTKQFQLVNLDPKDIKHDPETPNVRDRVKNTTDLQASIAEWGIQNPLEVRVVDGEFFLIGGHRRLTAAKALGLESVPCIVKEIDPDDVRVLMLISDMQKAFPHIVNDADGQVVGGRALAVYSLAFRGDLKNYQIARMIGIKSDIVGAYVALVQDCLEVRERVAAGDIDITVYSIIKRQLPEFTARLLKKKGRITATYVRKFKKRWPELRAEEARTEAEKTRQSLFEDFTEGEGTQGDTGVRGDTFPEEEEEYTTAFCINSAIEWLERVKTQHISPSDDFLLSKLEVLVGEL